MIVVDAIVSAIRGARFSFATEAELQAGIARILAAAGIDAAREVVLSARDRIDFLVGNVGVEVKIDGSHSALLRQLDRYAGLPQIGALVVVCGSTRLGRLPAALRDKPVRGVTILRGLS